jgi:hypothetical protein
MIIIIYNYCDSLWIYILYHNIETRQQIDALSLSVASALEGGACLIQIVCQLHYLHL